MAYKLEELRIVPNGLNLRPPGDQVAAGDCLDLQGWWPGSAGKLQQTKGFVNKSGSDAGVSLDSVGESDGRVYYGGGGMLGQIGRGSIDTGFDGYPLGLVSYQGRMWVMNASKQRKDDGTTVRDWTPAPPSAAPTVTAVGAIAAPTYTHGGTGTGQLLGPIRYIVTGVLTGHPTTEGECYRSADLLTTSDNSAPEIGPVSVPPGGWAGFADLESVTVTHPTLPSFVTAWNLYRLIGPLRRVLDTSFPDNYYRVNRDPIPLANTYQDKATDPGGSGDDQSDNALIAAGNILFTGIPGGTRYYVTGTNALSEETSPSPYLVVDGGDEILLNRPTLGSDSTFWNVYRQGGSNPPYLVNPDPIAAATTQYIDAGRDDTRYSGGIDQSDLGIANLGVILQTGSNLAPAARVAAPQTYNGRIVVANSAAHPNRVWFSKALQPASFPGTNAPDGNWVDIGTDQGDAVLAMSVKPGYMLFYRERSIWRLIGDFQDINSTIEPLMPSMGIVGPRAMVSTSLGDFALMRQGLYQAIYRITDFEHGLSAKIEPVLQGAGSENFDPIDLAARGTSALGYQLGRLWFSYPDSGHSVNFRTFVYDEVTARWFSRNQGFGAYANGSQFFFGSGADGDGKVYSLEDGFSDGGTATPMAYQSAYEDCGSPDREKTWGDLVIPHNLAGGTLTVAVIQNKKADATNDPVSLTTITSGSLTRQVIPLVYPGGYAIVAKRGLPIKSLSLSVRITGTAPATSPGMEIDSPLLLHYYLEARKGKTYDSGITSHGLDGVGSIDEIELDIDTSDGVASLTVQSDIPGGVLAASGSSPYAIPQTTGRQMVRFTLGTGAFGPVIDGRLFRHQISTATSFALYGYRVRILPVGVYVDGSQNQFWYTTATATGV